MSTIQGAILGVIGAVFFALVLTVYLQHRHLVDDQERYERLLTDNAAFQVENNNWKQMVKNQNQKIAAIAAEQTAREHATEESVRAAIKQADLYRRLAAQIQAQKQTGDDCQSANAIKDFYLRHRL